VKPRDNSKAFLLGAESMRKVLAALAVTEDLHAAGQIGSTLGS
jgi:hypothetical protein